MSLNGLDASAVVEAHQAALADPGGWFLLKYASRDTVELLSRGTGGVAEAKAAVEQYEEKSPIYGLVHYRRKRAMLKYVPVGTSRLLQVRLTVQFQSVTDAFPHDTVFSFNTPSELTESALGLSALLQPSTRGTSMSSAASLKHRRLDEISEDAEEMPQVAQLESSASTVTMSPPKRRDEQAPTPITKSPIEGLPASALKAKALLARRKEADLASDYELPTGLPAPAPVLSTPPAPAPIQTSSLPVLDKSLPATPQLSTPQMTPPSSRHGLSKVREEVIPPPLPTKSALRPSLDSTGTGPIVYHSSHLSPNASDSISQWNDQVAAYTVPEPEFKPKKKKLAPRPHVETSHRPKTSNNSIANMPQSVRTSSRANTSMSHYRPSSQQSSRSVPSRFVHVPSGPPPPLPMSGQLPSLFRAHEPRKPPSIASSAMTDNSVATPEKLRLMKALQLRKRNQILAQRAATSLSQRAPSPLEEEPPMRSPYRPAPHINDSVSRTALEGKSNGTSATASPTSMSTAFGAQSTKPSSVAGDMDGKNSIRQMNDESTASSTPRAAGLLEQSTAEHLDQGNSRIAQSPGATESVFPDARIQVRAATPEGPQTIVQDATPDQVREQSRVDEAVVKPPQAKGLTLPPRSSSRIEVPSYIRHPKQALLGMLKAPSSGNLSVNSDDDAFMDELQNATLHEAKPVSVARTPETPKMRKLSVDKIRDMTRTSTDDAVSSPQTTSSEARKPRSESMRSTSTVTQQYAHLGGEDATPVPLSKKSTLGSGITKRIKALEVVTNRTSSQNAAAGSRDSTASKSTFSALLNRASFVGQRSSSSMSVEKRQSRPPVDSSAVAQASHEQQTGSGPFMQALEEEGEEAYSMPKKGETISVTARIVRDNRRSATSATRYQNDASVNLYRSPLIVEHERRGADEDGVSTNISLSRNNLEQFQSSPYTEKSRFSFSSHRSGSTVKQHGLDGRASRMSGTSRMSAASRGNRSSKTISETSSIGDEKRSSKTSRLMKRVSGIGNRFGHIGQILSTNKDHVNQQETIVEQIEDDRRESVAESLLQMIDIGDVNVQFPETLLWKRRYMRIDDQGYLVFSPPTDNSHIPTAPRKFHLSDLKIPVLPDTEREEMAWSILLDIRTGGCIQCACENKKAQGHILRMLLDAHDAYNSLYK